MEKSTQRLARRLGLPRASDVFSDGSGLRDLAESFDGPNNHDTKSTDRTSCSIEASSDEDDRDDDSSSHRLTPRQSLALTLRNWSARECNAEMLQTGGAVVNLLELTSTALSFCDTIALGYCTEAVVNLARFPSLRAELLGHGAVKVISDTSSRPRKCFRGRVLRNLAESLFYLSLVRGAEEKMVSDGVENAIRSLMQQHRRRIERGCNEDPVLITNTCRKVLYNLTCSEATCEAAMHCLLGLRSRSASELAMYVAVVVPGICNNTSRAHLCPSLVEGGALQALSSALLVLTADADSCASDPDIPESISIAHQGAIALFNLASNGACRADMILQNSIATLKHVSVIARFDETLCVVAGALCELCACKDAALGKVIVGDGSLVHVFRNVLKHPENEVIYEGIARRCAHALNMIVSRTNDCIPQLVEAGALGVLIELCCVDDSETKLHCASILCNSAACESCHQALLESQTLPALFLLCSQIDETCVGAIVALALALLNLSKCPSTRESVVRAGAMAHLVTFAQCRSVAVMECCVEAFGCLAEVDANMHDMIQEGLFEALQTMVESDNASVITACARTFALVSRDMTSRYACMSASGIDLLRVLTQASRLSIIAPEALEYVLYSLVCLSATKEGRNILWDTLPIMTVATMARAQKDGTIRRRCAKLLGNLSMDDTKRSALVGAGVVGFISELSITFKEETLFECAACLCNLSASMSPEERLVMVKAGAARDLMAICTVRSMNDRTRLVSVKALTNLVADGTLALLCEEGIVRALEVVSNRDIDRAVCARLFLDLARQQVGCQWLSTRPLDKLFALVQKDLPSQVKVQCGLAALHFLRARPMFATVPGALSATKIAATLGNAQCELAACAAVASMASRADCHEVMVTSSISQVIVLIAQSERHTSVVGAVKALVEMSACEGLRPSLIACGAVSAVCALALSKRKSLPRVDLAGILCRLSRLTEGASWDASVPAARHLIFGVANLWKQSKRHDSPSHRTRSLCVRAIYELSKHKSMHLLLLELGGIRLLVEQVPTLSTARARSDQELMDSVQALAHTCWSPLLFRSVLATGAVEALSNLVKDLSSTSNCPLASSVDDPALWRALVHALFQFTATGPKYLAEVGGRGIVTPLVFLGRRCVADKMVGRYCAAALTNLSTEASNRPCMAEAGVSQFMVELSQRYREDRIESLERYCRITTANLSTVSMVDVAHLGSFMSPQSIVSSQSQALTMSPDDTGDGELSIQLDFLDPTRQPAAVGTDPFWAGDGAIVEHEFDQLALQVPTTVDEVRYRGEQAAPEIGGLENLPTPTRRLDAEESWSPICSKPNPRLTPFALPKIGTRV